MEKTDDPYAILGVPYDAEESKIKKAYYKLARVHHPDKQETEKEKEKATNLFAKISAAYDVLTDPVKRYDWKSANEGKIKRMGSAVPSNSPAPKSPPKFVPTPAKSTFTSPQPRRNSMPRKQPLQKSNSMPRRPMGAKPRAPNPLGRSMHGQPRGKSPARRPPANRRGSWSQGTQSPRSSSGLNGENPFEVLDLHWKSDMVEIIAAYRRLCQLHHPSKQRTDEGRLNANLKVARFQQAFEILKDPAKRLEWSVRSRGSAGPINPRSPRNGGKRTSGLSPPSPRSPRSGGKRAPGLLSPSRGLSPRKNIGLSQSLHSKNLRPSGSRKDIIKKKKAAAKKEEKVTTKDVKKEKKDKQKGRKKEKKPSSFLWKREKPGKKYSSSGDSFGTSKTSSSAGSLEQS